MAAGNLLPKARSVTTSARNGPLDENSPPLPAKGLHWLHLVLCTLERLAVADVLGLEKGDSTLYDMRPYAWIRNEVRTNWRWLSDLANRHSLVPP